MPLSRLLAPLTLVVLLAGAGWWWLSPGEPVSAGHTPVIPPAADQPITPIPQSVALDARKFELGRLLFHDARLSRDNTISCATCHDLERGGIDKLTRAKGIDGQIGELNSPTVLNSGFNFRQFWDGRAATLEEQAEGPVHNPLEMASNWKEVIAKLEQDPKYPGMFREIWPEGIRAGRIQEAIAEFERGLITPNSPFDQFLLGNPHVLSASARRGWERFRELGCIACHQGVNVGGNMYAHLGVMGDYFADLARPLGKSDMGRYNVTGREADRHLFKVPGLRGVAHTGPYFHDGSIPALEDAVVVMARYQLGISLEAEDRADLVAFLSSLGAPLAGNLP